MSESQHNDKTPTPMAEAGEPQARLEAEARRAIVTGADSGIVTVATNAPSASVDAVPSTIGSECSSSVTEEFGA